MNRNIKQAIQVMKYDGIEYKMVIPYLNRGSYMSAYDLLNLLNEFGERDKM